MGVRGPLASKNGRKVPRDSGIIRLRSLPGGKPPSPPPDAGWLTSTKTAWGNYWKSGLVDVVIVADLEVIFRLFRNYDRYDRLLELVTETPTITHRGEVRLHPLTMECHRLAAAIRADEAVLGKTPKSREKLKIAVGQATLTAQEINRRSRQSVKPSRKQSAIDAEYTET